MKMNKISILLHICTTLLNFCSDTYIFPNSSSVDFPVIYSNVFPIVLRKNVETNRYDGNICTDNIFLLNYLMPKSDKTYKLD